MMNISMISLDVLENAARKVFAHLPATVRYSLNGRLERGLYLAANGSVLPHVDPNRPWHTRLYLVLSSNQYAPPYSYLVDVDAMSCECPDHQKGHHCKHILAVQIMEMARRKMV